MPVDRHNRPLALDRRWRRNLAAQCWLWKDPTGWCEAARITALAAQLRARFIARCGNTYSSEWWWSKIWHCLAVAPDVFAAAWSWVELADWVPAVLAGGAHHTGFSHGVTAEMLEDFADIAGVALVRIDAGTRLADFQQTLRTNEVYYYLAQGLRG
jgi:L-ribulokinase